MKTKLITRMLIPVRHHHGRWLYCTTNRCTSCTCAKQKYGLFMSHMTNAFTIELSDAVKAKAAELGVELTVYDGGQDAAKQVGQLETAVTQGISGVVIEPVSVDGIVPAIEAATKAGIPVVVVNQKISKPEAASAFVGVSNVEGGVMEMKTAAEAIGGKGNVAFLLGPMGSDAQLGSTEGYYKYSKTTPISKSYLNKQPTGKPMKP